MLKMNEGHVIKTDGILTADDLAPTMGAMTYREWMYAVREASKFARAVMKHKRIGEKVQGPPLYAEIIHGRWVVNCECGGQENVTPNDPVVFCFSCLNVENDFNLRPVVFPNKQDQKVIETLLMKRARHRDMAWKHDEPILNLEAENKELKKKGRAK